jgi:plastocyanin
MKTLLFCKPVVLSLGLGATLAAALAGCGGATADKDTAILVPEPNANLTARATKSAPGAAPAGGAAAPAAGASTAPAAAPVKAEGWGTLKGKVTFGGDPPTQVVLQAVGKAAKDPEVCAKTTPIMSERLVVDSGTKGVKNVFVYLMRPTAVNDEYKKTVAAAPVDFDQKNCTFSPHALAVMVGTPVTLRSSDNTNHNVSFQLRNLQKNPLLAPMKSAVEIPTAPERTPGPVSCSIHPWMQAYWMVLDHPYYAVTDAQGNFEIKNAPAGTQKVVVWQEAVGFVSSSGAGEDVNIKPSDTTSKDFTIDPSKVKPAG